jgi:hypothetical protein
MAGLETKRDALKILTSVQYKENGRSRRKFVNNFEEMMKIFLIEVTSKYLGDDCFSDYEEMKVNHEF